MSKTGKILFFVVIIPLGVGGVVALGWMVSREEPVLQVSPYPDDGLDTVVDPVDGRIVEGDENSYLVVGTDQRGWHILMDDEWNLQVHFPAGWYFTRDVSTYLGTEYVSYMFQDKRAKGEQPWEYNDSWHVRVATNNLYIPDPHNGFIRPSDQSNAYMKDLEAKITTFNGYEAYSVTKIGKEQSNRTIISFVADDKLYEVDVSAHEDRLTVWSNAQYFLNKLKLIQ